MHALTKEFYTLFEGHNSSYGTYTLTGEVKDNGKQVGTASSHSKPVTEQLYSDHLQGKKGLGITPINKESKVKFAAIDIDEYPLDLVGINERIIELDLPIMVCRTKSGGAHLYLFTSEWVAAAVAQKKLREMASILGYGTSEIYPRQAQLLADRGDVGNWINIPYFDEKHTMRYALDADSQALKLVDFIKVANSKRISLADLVALRFVAPEVLPGGPPCLQQLVKQGFPEGTRNNGLMNLGVFAQKAYGDQFEKYVEEYNNKYMSPPLPAEEVLQVIRSLNKKEYSYACKSQPIQAFCNASVCRTCKFGVGGAELGMPKFGTLTKIDVVPPIWFLDVEVADGVKRMELTTDELQQPVMFQKRCMESLNIMPLVLKRDGWSQIVQKLLTELQIVPIPMEATPFGQLMNHLEYFCTSKVQAKHVDELLMGKPWIKDNEIHFRLQDFLQHLAIRKYTLLPLNRIAVALKSISGCRKDFHNVKGKGINVYVVPTDIFNQQTQSFDTPEQPKEAI